MIKLIPSLPEALTVDKNLVATALKCDVLFEGPGFVGGVGRPYALAEREIWVRPLEGFSPRLLPHLRKAVRLGAEHFGYLRARVPIGNKKAARFAFKCGFMWEEDTASFHYFSVRA